VRSGAIGDLITLGTAQFGLDYGITNRTGCPSDEKLRSILRTAWAGGIRHIDTARSYGNSEERLGRLLPETEGATWHITTKIAPLEQMREAHECAADAGAAALSLDLSLAALQSDSVDLLLLHAFEDMGRPGVLDRLELERDRGRFGDLGVSVYDPDEAVECLEDPRIRHIQLPLNLLDRRWFEGAFEPALAKRSDVTIHVRSAFLQGLLLNGPEFWPAWVRNADEIDAILTNASRELEAGRIELCLRYLTSVPWVDRIVVGVDSEAQLRQTLSIGFSEPLPANLLRKLDEAAALVPPRLLNPSLW
jgi:spore coat polysaccharide biosynthesis protein SpsF